MEKEPLISVIIPAYNEGDYIARALESVRNQTYDRLETVVVANGCTDDTAEIARNFATEIGLVNRVIEVPEQGISYAKNFGAQEAQGNVYAFMDADSEMKDDLLEKVHLLIANGYTGGKAKIRPLDDKRFRAKLFCWYSEALSRLTEKVPFIDSGAGAFTFVTRDLFKLIEATYGKGYRTNLKLMEDVDFLIKVKKHGNYKFLTESCLYTSMRRFVEEGYFKCFVEDCVHVVKPKGKTRKRWIRK